MVVEAVAGGDHLARVDGGQLTGEDFAEQSGEPAGQGFGQADLAPGGPLPEPGGQGDLGGGHRVDEPDLVVDLDRAPLGQPQLVGAGVRDRDQLRPLDRVRHPLQLTGDLEQLVRVHPGTAARPAAAPTAAASARNAAIRSRSWLVDIPHHTRTRVRIQELSTANPAESQPTWRRSSRSVETAVTPAGRTSSRAVAVRQVLASAALSASGVVTGVSHTKPRQT